ncbi:MAG TPA: carboxymuconolactone decarboxylase family protein [Polyangiales bacterium]|jgi:alkylhydroperoxidase family enzyme|nr:carboxymuconolactone decarboxylase family protein [Polyangiales bacterium]
MARVPLVEVAAMTPDQRAQYDRFPSNLSRALVLTPARLAGMIPSLANALRASGLDAKIREGVILRVAALSACEFERMQHLGEAAKAGWTAAEIAAIEAGHPPAEIAAILAFVDECVALVRVGDAAFAAVRAILSPREIATLIVLIGHYMMVARFLRTLDIELDPAPSTWETEH